MQTLKVPRGTARKTRRETLTHYDVAADGQDVAVIASHAEPRTSHDSRRVFARSLEHARHKAGFTE
jgi:hypothetical protein